MTGWYLMNTVPALQVGEVLADMVGDRRRGQVGDSQVGILIPDY